MNLALVVILSALMHAVRSFRVGNESGSTGTTLALGYVLLAAFFVGGYFQKAKLPRLTGYIVAGVIAGPEVLGLLSDAMVDNLRLVNGMAVALIALTAGTELELHAMRPLFKVLSHIGTLAIGGTAALLSVGVFLVRGWLPFFSTFSTGQALAASVLLGVTLAAQSPAVVVALRDELEAEGPVSRTVLGVVVLADLAVIVLFAFASIWAKTAMTGGADVLETLEELALALPGSVVAGVAMGFLLAVYLERVRGSAPLFVLLIAFVIAEVGQRLALDPLLVALAAGATVRNASKMGDRLHAHTLATSLPVHIVFFAVTGAALRLDVVVTSGLPAIGLALLRAGGLLLGTRLAAKMAKAPDAVVRFAGYGLLPQAGLAIALAQLISKTFPGFGPAAATFTLAIVTLNTVVTPPLYRLALSRAGEVGRGAASHAPEPEVKPAEA